MDSKESISLQIADLLTGAINSGHHLHINPKLQISPGKKLFIAKMAEMLGWPSLIYDTWPNVDFNIWHFPKEFRASPATRALQINLDVSYVTAVELKALHNDSS